MINSTLEYAEGASLPDGHIWWIDTDGDPIDFSSGWTFSAEVGVEGAAATFSKASDITGATGSGDGRNAGDTPNVVIAWAASGEITTLTAGTYMIELTATRDSDSKTRIQHITLVITDGIG